MEYKFLGQALHRVAENAGSYFRDKHGVTSMRAEEEVARDINYRPTLQGRTQDHYILCVEVTDVGFSGSLESFVLACGNRGLPVKCYVAVPRGIDDATYRAIHQKAREIGVGLVEIADDSCDLVQPAMPMTLFGYRRPDPKEFPRKYRPAVSDAESTLRGGDPVKACSRIYDEIERVTRDLAKTIDKRGLWRPLHTGEKRPGINLDRAPWEKVLELLQRHANFSSIRAVANELTPTLVGKILGIVPHRNDSGHKPSSKNALIKRDRELRTRFEHAVDTLRDVVFACQPLRIR